MLEEKKQRRGGISYGITLVDAGMVAQLTDEEASTFIGLLASLGEGDGFAAAHFTLQFSIENNLTEEEKQNFTKDMCQLFADKCQGYGTNVDVGDVLRGILELVRLHRVRIDANFATLVINVLCIEALARRVCPSYCPLDTAQSLLQGYRRVCFQSDGITPKRNPKTHQRLKRLMPLMLHTKKKRADDVFFRQIAKKRQQKLDSSLEGS